MCWQSMDTAPKTGEIVVGDYDGWPVMMAWMANVPRKEYKKSGGWFPRQEYVEVERETGWRVLIPTREFGYSLHGNYGPFQPRQWMPLTRASVASSGRAPTKTCKFHTV